ncbi:hypothetical protein, partial [Klebsiella oxytoca]|uniref:hypothetical protein n=1 Tax=Klebsiella oxytoca TaxID=571 RepID=UPI0029DCB824|nr:hypothetical protein [Klebsiella oxytoca]
GTADRNRSHWSTSKTPSYTKSVSWQYHRICIWGMLAHGAFLFGMNNLIKGSSAQPKGLQN